jgi:ATP-dependent RNA helicase DDX60
MTIRGVIEQLMSRESREADVQSSVDETEGIDSGYGTSDAAEHIEDDDSGITRPLGVSNEDWRVYEVVNEALVEFNIKFKAMWA